MGGNRASYEIIYKEFCCGLSYNGSTQRYSFSLRHLNPARLRDICRCCHQSGDPDIEERDICWFINNTANPEYEIEWWNEIDTGYVIPGEIICLECSNQQQCYTQIRLMRLGDNNWLVLNATDHESLLPGATVVLAQGTRLKAGKEATIGDVTLSLKKCGFAIPGRYHRLLDAILFNGMAQPSCNKGIYDLYNMLTDYHSDKLIERNFDDILQSFSDYGQSTFVMRHILDTITHKK